MAKTLLRWLKRYGPSEIFGTMGAYAGFFLTEHFAGIAWIDAYGGAMGENLGFYGVISYQRMKAKEKWWHVFAEFGPAELLDSFIIRPLTLYMGVKFLGPVLGIFAGKITGDIIFYIPVILTHEWIRFKYDRFKSL